MLVFVLNQHGKPLMPCKPKKARKLLEDGKAKVVKTVPFTIQLNYGSSGYKQALVAGMDTGSKDIGVAVVGLGKVFYQAEVRLRQNVSKKMQQRVKDLEASHASEFQGRERVRAPIVRPTPGSVGWAQAHSSSAAGARERASEGVGGDGVTGHTGAGRWLR